LRERDRQTKAETTMPEPYISLDDLQKSGEALLEILRQCEPSLEYDEQSIAWLDGYIARNRHTFSERSRDGVAVAVGAIVGETIVRSFRTEWVFDESVDQWLVSMGTDLGRCNPIGKAYKALTDDFNSIASFYRITKLAIERGGLDKLAALEKPS
jgi:hypothetical protein